MSGGKVSGVKFLTSILRNLLQQLKFVFVFEIYLHLVLRVNS